MLDDPVLRTFYDLEFVSPTGQVIVPGVTIGGIAIQETSRHTYKIYRIVFPDIAQAGTYVGDWLLRLTPNGEWSEESVKRALAESDINHSSYINPYQGLARISHTCFSRFDFTEIRTISGSLWVMRLPMAAVRAAMAVLTGLHTARGVFEAHLDRPRPVKIFWFALARLVS